MKPTCYNNMIFVCTLNTSSACDAVGKQYFFYGQLYPPNWTNWHFLLSSDINSGITDCSMTSDQLPH